MNKLQCWGGKLTTIETNWHIFTVTAANGCFVLIRNSLVFAVVIHVYSRSRRFIGDACLENVLIFHFISLSGRVAIKTIERWRTKKNVKQQQAHNGSEEIVRI